MKRIEKTRQQLQGTFGNNALLLADPLGFKICFTVISGNSYYLYI